MNWMDVQEALLFFGLEDMDELELLVLDHDIDALVDQGRVVAIDANDVREALFELHRKRAGYRPDDQDASAAAREVRGRIEEAERRARQSARGALRARHGR
jgi:hypothetical protein